MGAIASALLFSMFVWWFATGLVLLVVLRGPRTVRISLAAAAVLFPISLLVLARTATSNTSFGVYAAFTAAVVLWGTQEVAFLTGFLTGPRPMPCPPGARRFERFRHAVGAILYHEIALLVTGAAVLAVTWGGSDPFGALTFAVLWVMRISAKLNLFLGVPVLNDEVLPEPVVHLRTYFRRGPVNAFFPVALVCSLVLVAAFAAFAVDPGADQATSAGYALVAAMVALAILEHAFMLIPLPIHRLWRWSTGVAT